MQGEAYVCRQPYRIGKQAQDQAAGHIDSFVFWPVPAVGNTDPDPVDLHRSASKNSIDDIPGSATATTATAPTAGSGREGGEDSERLGQWPAAHAHQDSRESPDE